VVVVLAGLGLATLASLSTRPVVAAGLAALAMAWYNGVYTPLKRVTIFAVVPGAVIGAIPPVIGWVAAGGRLSDGAIWFVAAFFFLWQVPHFWLLTLMHGTQYAKAGLRTLADRFTNGEIARLTFAWQLAAACAAPLAAVGARAGGAATVTAAALSMWLVVSGRPLLRTLASAADYRRAFMRINFYALGISATLAAAPWLR
jgi:protoheme IX farnesyltransferase